MFQSFDCRELLKLSLITANETDRSLIMSFKYHFISFKLHDLQCLCEYSCVYENGSATEGCCLETAPFEGSVCVCVYVSYFLLLAPHSQR